MLGVLADDLHVDEFKKICGFDEQVDLECALCSSDEPQLNLEAAA